MASTDPVSPEDETTWLCSTCHADIHGNPILIDNAPICDYCIRTGAEAQENGTTHQCTACFDDIQGKPILVGNAPMCGGCIRTGIVPMFHEALKNELKYPVKFGTTEIEPYDCYMFFDNWDKFFKAWLPTTIEYRQEMKNRLYCLRCSTFVHLLPYSPDEELNLSATCEKCHAVICGACGAEGHKAGTCTEKDKPQEDALKGVSNTKRCPRCGAAFYLHEGCNSITCTRCKVKWCWCCMMANPQFDHWAPGSACPKWHQADDANAQWLPAAAAVDHEEARRPEVVIPPLTAPDGLSFYHEGAKEHITDLTFLDLVHPVDSMSDQAVEVSHTLLDFPHLVIQRRGATQQQRWQRAFDVCEHFRIWLNTAKDALLANEEELRAAGAPVFVMHGMINELTRNVPLLHSREALEEDLEQALLSHLTLIHLFKLLRGHPALRKDFEYLPVVIAVYFHIMPERLMVAASDRHLFREHMMWQPTDEEAANAAANAVDASALEQAQGLDDLDRGIPEELRAEIAAALQEAEAEGELEQ